MSELAAEAICQTARVKLVAVAIALCVLLAGCAPAENASTVRFAVAGDSLTAWTNDSFPEPTGDFADVTWLHWTISPTLELAGGYARQGARSTDVARQIDVVDADVLVVMVGSNDIGVAAPPQVLAAISEIVERAGVDAVVLCAIPPQRGYTTEMLAHNEALAALALENDWTFVDPWVSVRDGNGEWIEALTFDGVHPTAEGAEAAGIIISAAVDKAAS